MIRFHLDENLSPAIAVALRGEGVDVTTSRDADLLGQGDQDQFAFAQANQRTLVTCDDDFLGPEYRLRDHFGICYCHPQKYGIGEMVEALLIVHHCGTEAEMRNHFEFL